MQEEIVEKSVEVGFRISNLTLDLILKGLDAISKGLEKNKGDTPETPAAKRGAADPELKQGKQTLKQLHKHNEGLSAIELTDPNLRQLHKAMKQADIDFSCVKDGKGKYTLFFKGKNADEMTSAFRRYTQKVMGGLDTPTSGNVKVRDMELSQMSDEQLTIFRRRNIGFVFQNYNLVPILNVHENIVLPVELDGDTVDKAFMNEVVGMLGLKDKLQNMPNNLSGGQQQRVSIARALITKPAVVLADEPTGNLDSRTSSDVLGLIKRTSNEFNQTVVMITHNSEIAQLADRIIRIEDGRIVGQAGV